MRKFRYIEPGEDDEAVVVILTEEELLAGPWVDYTKKNHEKYVALCTRTGMSIPPPLTNEDIIDEFIVTHWAEVVVE